MTIHAVWHGGTNYSRSKVGRDLEEFETIADAVDALKSRDRYGHGYRQEFAYVLRDRLTTYTPVCDDAEMHVYLGLTDDDIDAIRDYPHDAAEWEPDRVIRLTPRGAARDDAGRYY